VGRRAASRLVTSGFDVVLVAQKRLPPAIDGVVSVRGWPNAAADGADIVVLATESAHQYAIADTLIRTGTTVVSTADDPAQIARLWSLDSIARDQGAALIVGAAYSPGVSTLLAAYLTRCFDSVSTISTAQFGTGGPACAREHHRAMSAAAHEVHRGLLRESRGGTGRELVWFPDPIGAADCYRAGLADPFLLHQAFPAVFRVESRQAATRRDRLTARLPMLRPPHPEGLVGAVWAEVRGTIGGRVEHRSMAATAPQATGAAAMVAGFCELLRDEGVRPGTQSAATTESEVSLLKHVSDDVRLWTYDGSRVVTKSGVDAPTQAARKWRRPNENVANTTF